MNPGLAECKVSQRTDRFHVGPSSDLRHHATEAGVKLDLRSEDVG